MDRLLQDIQGAEGCKLVAYKDSLGYWTIGYGHLLPAGRDWTGYTITQQTADVYLEADINDATQAAKNLPEWLCLDTDCRRNALVELVFNMGAYKWRKFLKTRVALQCQKWATAAAELLNSQWAAQVGPTRTHRLAQYFSTGIYP